MDNIHSEFRIIVVSCHNSIILKSTNYKAAITGVSPSLDVREREREREREVERNISGPHCSHDLTLSSLKCGKWQHMIELAL